jgi:hypothetical protein
MCKRLIYLFVDNARYWRIKEKLRWIRQAQSVQAARWRLTNFLRHANEQLDPDPLLDPVRKAIATVKAQKTDPAALEVVTQQRPPGRAETACSRPPGHALATTAPSPLSTII